MHIAEKIEEVRRVVKNARSEGKAIGFVPTMGALHKGHISLIESAKKRCDFVVVSIFVNPAQFGPTEDIERYPRNFEQDKKICAELGVDMIFAPTVETMYPQRQLSWVSVDKLGDNLCGSTRGGHFKGVATVCAKLFNIVNADLAFFGQKDAQQAIIIERMVKDLNIPLKIVVCPTVRQDSGLAMSSRNQYLTDEQKKQARLIYAALQEAEVLITAGIIETAEIVKAMTEILKIGSNIKIDYISIVNAENLEAVEVLGGKILIAIAAFVGKARLIDNIILDLNR